MTVAGALDATATVSVMFCAAPDAPIDDASVQVTSGGALVQVQLDPVAETNVSPVGRLSVTVVAPAVKVLPVLLTAIVNTPFCPGVKFPEWLFVIAIFGAGGGFTVIVSVEVLFEPVVSPGDATVAVLLKLPVTVEATATVIARVGAVPPPEIGPGFVQVTV
jgi:hypothetical protein